MSRMHRAGMAVVLGVLAAGAASRAQAQIQGMPLFTNPRYATGFRVHADLGLPTDTKVGLGDYSVIQGGVTFALGPVGLGANVGATRNDFKNISNGTGGTVGAQTKITASALAQLRVYGGGASPFALSLFGGASMDVQAYQFSGLARCASHQHADHDRHTRTVHPRHRNPPDWWCPAHGRQVPSWPGGLAYNTQATRRAQVTAVTRGRFGDLGHNRGATGVPNPGH